MKTINNSEGQGSLPFQSAYPTLNYFTTLNLDKELKMEQEEDKKIWGFIYLYIIRQKGYVGYTNDLKERIYYHLADEKHNQYFHKSLRKYFRPGDLRTIEAHYDTPANLVKILNEREIFWITELGTYDPEQKKGWNLTTGGDGGDTFTGNPNKNKIRKTHSENRKKYLENHPELKKHLSRKLKGKPKTKEHRENISKGLIKRFQKPEEIEKISGKNHHNWGKPGTFSGKRHTKKAKQIISNKIKKVWEMRRKENGK